MESSPSCCRFNFFSHVSCIGENNKSNSENRFAVMVFDEDVASIDMNQQARERLQDIIEVSFYVEAVVNYRQELDWILIQDLEWQMAAATWLEMVFRTWLCCSSDTVVIIRLSFYLSSFLAKWMGKHLEGGSHHLQHLINSCKLST